MIYTIGSLSAYRKAFESNLDIYKLGKQTPNARFPDGYTGGYAFKTVKDALYRIETTYSDTDFVVFRIDCTWANTYPADDGWWAYLIEDALVLWPPIT